MRNVDDVVPATLGKEPDFTAGSDDQLRAGAVLDDRIGGRDRLGVDELERPVARDRLHDPTALEGQLLVVRERDDGASAALFGVHARDAMRALLRLVRSHLGTLNFTTTFRETSAALLRNPYRAPC